MSRVARSSAAAILGGTAVETVNLFWDHHWLYGLIAATAVAVSCKVAGRRIA